MIPNLFDGTETLTEESRDKLDPASVSGATSPLEEINHALQIIFLCNEITQLYPQSARGMVAHANAAAARLAGIIGRLGAL